LGGGMHDRWPHPVKMISFVLASVGKQFCPVVCYFVLHTFQQTKALHDAAGRGTVLQGNKNTIQNS